MKKSLVTLQRWAQKWLFLLYMSLRPGKKELSIKTFRNLGVHNNYSLTVVRLIKTLCYNAENIQTAYFWRFQFMHGKNNHSYFNVRVEHPSTRAHTWPKTLQDTFTSTIGT